MSRYLSGSELMNQSHKNNDLPGRGGFKENVPDGSWLQKKKLEEFHDDRHNVLSEERMERFDSISTGIWDPQQQKVVVIKNRGKFWKNMGHCIDGKKLLHPEEALFLVDQGVMEVTYQGHPMSLQELYHKLLPSRSSYTDYMVCSHLMRIGFIVRRTETSEESTPKINADKKRPRDDDDDNHGDDDDDDDDDMKLSIIKKLKSDSHALAPAMIPDTAGIQQKQDDDNILNLLDIFNSDKISVDPRILSGALPGLELSRSLEFDFSKERKEMTILGKDVFQNPERRNNCGGVKDWTEWKTLSRKQKVLQTRAKVLWADDLRPLHDPDVVCSPGETLRRLGGGQPGVYGEFERITRKVPKQGLNPQMFDVFPPDSKFKKLKPGRPLACAVTVGADSPPPLGMEALKMIREAQNSRGTSMLVGVAEAGEVSFFSYNLVTLPSLL